MSKITKELQKELQNIERKGIKEEWKEMERKIKTALEDRKIGEERGKKKKERRGWWDEECRERKKELRRGDDGMEKRGRRGRKV